MMVLRAMPTRLGDEVTMKIIGKVLKGKEELLKTVTVHTYACKQ